MAKPKRVYYAAPLFTDAERSWNAANAAAIRARLPHIELLMPQEFCATFEAGDTADTGKGRLGKPDYGAIFRSCRDHIDTCDFMLAVLDGPDPDSGTAWEMGYAYARGIDVIGLRTDWRPAEDGAANCMLARACAKISGSLAHTIDLLEGWTR